MVQRAIIAYLIALIVMAVLAWFFLISPGIHHKSTSTTTIVHAASSSTSTIIGQLSTTTASSTTTTIKYGSCGSSSPTVQILNGNFSTRNYTGWNASGYGFMNTEDSMDGPINISYINAHGLYYNWSWSGYNGNFVATSYQIGINVRTGNLTSKPFLVTEPYLNFKILSPANSALYVVLLVNGKPYITTYFNTYAVPGNTHAPSTFYNASIPVAAVICQNVSVKLVAGVVGNVANRLQYIAAGDFYMSKTPVATPGVVVNQTIS